MKKRRDDEREDERQDQDKMKRDRDEKRGEQIQKNVSRPSNPPDELAQHVSKKIPVGRFVPPFFFESSESVRFFFNYFA